MSLVKLKLHFHLEMCECLNVSARSNINVFEMKIPHVDPETICKGRGEGEDGMGDPILLVKLQLYLQKTLGEKTISLVGPLPKPKSFQ